MRMLYVIGEPGSGKSTLVAALTDGLRFSDYEKPVPHRQWYADRNVYEIGRYRESFSGTDGLGMAIMPKAIDAFRPPSTNGLTESSCFLAEGDRLASAKFFDALLGLDVELEIAHLYPPPDVAGNRRRERARALGVREQNPSWVKGRASKVLNLAARYADRTIPLLAESLIENVAALVEESRVAALLALSERP